MFIRSMLTARMKMNLLVLKNCVTTCYPDMLTIDWPRKFLPHQPSPPDTTTLWLAGWRHTSLKI